MTLTASDQRRERPIAVCGHLCLDVIPGFGSAPPGEGFLTPGSLTLVETPVISTGGAVGNVGIDLWRLGVPVELVARIGDDAFGSLVRERLAREDESLVRGLVCVPGAATSYTIVLSPPGVDRSFLHCPGANDGFTPTDVDDHLLESVAVLHFGYPPLLERIFSDGGDALTCLFRRARARGVLTSLDMTLPDPASRAGGIDWEAFLARVLPETDLFAPSLGELLFMVDRPAYQALREGRVTGGIARVDFATLRAASDRLLEWGVGASLIKLGEWGLYLRTGDTSRLDGDWARREIYCPAFRVRRVVGTTGAGDAAVAGFLAGLRERLPVEEALAAGAAVGACSVEASDASSGVAPWDATLQRIRSGWERRVAPLPSGDWSMGKQGTWRGPADGG